MTKTELKKFFTEHPSLSPTAIGTEAGYVQGSHLRKALRDEAPEEIKPKLAARLLPVLIKYGWIPQM